MHVAWDFHFLLLNQCLFFSCFLLHFMWKSCDTLPPFFFRFFFFFDYFYLCTSTSNGTRYKYLLWNLHLHSIDAQAHTNTKKYQTKNMCIRWEIVMNSMSLWCIRKSTNRILHCIARIEREREGGGVEVIADGGGGGDTIQTLPQNIKPFNATFRAICNKCAKSCSHNNRERCKKTRRTTENFQVYENYRHSLNDVVVVQKLNTLNNSIA